MLDALIKYSLRNRASILFLFLAIIIYGVYVGSNLPIDVFPDLNKPTVVVMTEAHGLAPEEVETLVTFPIEVALNGTPGIQRMRSSSGVGLSIIWLEFEWGTDIYRNRQLVAEKLSFVRERLPQGIIPVMSPITSIMGEIQLVGVSSPDQSVSPMDLRTIADWTIRPRLLAIPGISQVIPIGGGVREFQIYLNSSLMRKYNLSIEEVYDNLQGMSENSTGGFVNLGSQEYLIRNLGRIENKEDIEESFVGVFRGKAIRLKDIAEIKVGKQVMRGDASINGKSGVILAIKKQPGTSTLELVESVDTTLEVMKKTLPQGVAINKHLFKQSTFIESSIENVKEALRDGAILVTIILFLFLMSFRTTFITLMALPTSLAMTAIVFYFFNLEINTMTLGGIAIAIGLLVDDAIVDVENVFRRLKENKGEPVLKVVFMASREVRSSIVFATIIVILSFTPLFFMGGLAGRFFTPLGISFIVSLLASMFVSLTLTPVLCSFILPKIKDKKDKGDIWLVRVLKGGDKKIVLFFMKRPMLIIIPTLMAFIGVLFLLPKMNKEFLPKFNEGTAMVSVKLAPGVSLDYSNEKGLLAEKAILSIPEVKHVSRRTGRAELDEHAEGVNTSEIDVDFYRHKGRKRSIVLNDIRSRLNKLFPNGSINIGQPISHRLDHMLAGVNAQIALKIFGQDTSKLKAIASKLYQSLKKVEGLVDLQIEKQVNIPQIKSYLIREDAQRYNINIGKIAKQLDMALQGEVVAEVIKDQMVTNVFSRLSDSSRSSLKNMKNLVVKVMPDGEKVTLEKIADVYKSSGPNMINRENMQRRLIIQANVSGRGLDKVIKDIKEILEATSLPAGYHTLIDGQFKSQEEASMLMTITGIGAMLVTFLLLYSYFQSVIITFQIMLSIPLAVIGSILAIYLTDKTISTASIVAFVALCGIASRNGILMISHYLTLMAEEGEKFSKKMILRGTLERLVPVLMTAISAMLGLVPLLLSKGAAGKEILYPVAVVIVGGLFSSTILDMWVTPAVFYLIGQKSAEKYAENFNKKKVEL